ncbi:MAG: FkbM family methyltransferase [Cyanophyceae cyanobacterium]
MDILDRLLSAGLIFDSRPEFNGEYQLYRFLTEAFEITSNLLVGASEDFFYLSINPSSSFCLIEPSKTAAQALLSYSQDRLINCKISTFPLWKGNAHLDFYLDFTSFYPRLPLESITQALTSGLVLDPYLQEMVEKGVYRAERIQGLERTTQLEVRGGDQLLKDVLNIPRVDFIKLDVEGAEVDVLEGLKETVQSASFIQFEFGTTWFHSGKTIADTLNVISDAAFFFYVILKDRIVKVKPHWINQYFFCNVLATRIDFGEELYFSSRRKSLPYSTFM